MSLYPDTIARCQHIKVNGTQCGSPALRNRRFCYFHLEWRAKRLQINANIRRERAVVTLPVLEDANSIQVAVMQVMRLLVTQTIEHRTAGLLLYALQTASSNLARCTFEPELPTRVVIDRAIVAKRPIGATAWSAEEGREYDDASIKKDDEEEDDSLARTLLEGLGLPPDAKLPVPDEEKEEEEEKDDAEMVKT